MALVATAGAPGKGAIGASTPISRAGYGNYNKAKDVLKNVFAKTGNDANSVMQRTKAYVDSQKPQTQTYYGGGGGGNYSVAYEQPDYSGWFNMMADIQNAKHDAQVQLANRLKQATDDNINLSTGYNLREWRKMYGDKRNGQGLSNKLNIFYDRDKGLRENEANYQNNLLQAKAGQFTDLSGLTGQLANMDNNTIKKIMSHVSSL